jgi:hypothetical protein
LSENKKDLTIFVKVKNKLKRTQYNIELKKQIIERMKQFDNLGSLKFDQEMLRFVCSCLENSFKPKYEKKQKTDKKALVIEIFNELFNLLIEKEKEKCDRVDKHKGQHVADSAVHR